MTATLAAVPFADLAAQVRLDDPSRSAREAAFAEFAAIGIPGARDEEWRFTPVRHLATANYRVAGPSPDISESAIASFLVSGAQFRLVLVDGRVDLRLSRIPTRTDVRLAPLATAVDGQFSAGDAPATPFASLNAALWTDGAALRIEPGAVVASPIEILHVATPNAANTVITPRTVIEAGALSQSTVIENFVSLTGDAYFTNSACQIAMADGARLEHVRIQREGRAATHIGITTVRQARNSHYRSFTLALGGRVSRHNLHAHLDASNVETLLYGLYLGRGEQVVDNHTAIFHDHPNCNSWEVYKGVLAERSRGVFNGKVIVQPAAQKTDAKQTNRNLLLSDDAKVNTKPQLEIFADDVRCTHGATVGKLDEQQRYYLRTRGIAGRAAEMMLINAFVAEVLAEVTALPVRAALESIVHAEMDALIG